MPGTVILSGAEIMTRRVRYTLDAMGKEVVLANRIDGVEMIRATRGVKIVYDSVTIVNATNETIEDADDDNSEANAKAFVDGGASYRLATSLYKQGMECDVAARIIRQSLPDYVASIKAMVRREMASEYKPGL